MKRKLAFVNDKLACYYSGEKHNWDKFWQPIINPSLYPNNSKPYLGELQIILDYLPKDGKILEAGCGTGIYVWYLIKYGYDCEGIDNAEDTINKVLQLKPELPIRLGDVLNIDKPDYYYEGLISLGVIEHKPDGPEEFIKEMARVLKPGGIAIVAFPVYNVLRKIKSFLSLYPKKVFENDFFYQYYLDPKEVEALLIKYKLFPVKDFYMDIQTCINDDIISPSSRNHQKVSNIIKKICGKNQLLKRCMSHSYGLICRKENTEA